MAQVTGWQPPNCPDCSACATCGSALYRMLDASFGCAARSPNVAVFPDIKTENHAGLALLTGAAYAMPTLPVHAHGDACLASCMYAQSSLVGHHLMPILALSYDVQNVSDGCKGTCRIWASGRTPRRRSRSYGAADWLNMWLLHAGDSAWLSASAHVYHDALSV